MRDPSAVPFAGRLRTVLRLILLSVLFVAPLRAQVPVPGRRGTAQLEARQQRIEGKMFYAEGDVEIRFGELRLRADRVEYNSDTGEALARGHVQFDADVQHIEAEEVHYNLRAGRGRFTWVRGSVRVLRRPRAEVLASDNPLYFEAEEIEKLDERTYRIRSAWLTICEPTKPSWQFFAPRATVTVEESVALVHANFRLFRIPLIYLPYATAPIGRQRQSGFLIPRVANSSSKGFTVGDSFFWAVRDWADITLGGELLSRRGFSHMGELRAKPWAEARLQASYLAVNDRGLRGPDGRRVSQSGYETHIELDARLAGGWRAVADLNQLSSLAFRLAFAPTFEQAAQSEVRSTASLTNNSRGFSLGFSAGSYKNFLSAAPETAVVLRDAPGVRFSSVEQAPWKHWPVYLGFHVSAAALHRSDPDLETPAAVQRLEIAPRLTIPLRWGPWISLIPTFLVRSTRYGAQLDPAGNVTGMALRRNTAEITVDLRPPALARVWERPRSKWKHSIEPKIVYRYVNGVHNFGRFLRFDETDLLTDTNEFEYSITQRFFRRPQGDSTAGGQSYEIMSWRVAQKYYFDPAFGGALVEGRRNVFQALNSVTPFAFADRPRRFSPITSDLQITPGGRYDAQFRVDYDTTRSRVTAFGALLKMRPYRETFLTLAHFSTRATDALQLRSNQVRAWVGYGEITRRGWNVAFGLSYDVRQGFLQSQVIQVSYNGSCCGIGFEYRRLALGPVRSENQFRVTLFIANIGTFGTARRPEKIF